MLPFMDYLKRLFTIAFAILFICEYFIYDIVIYQCSWPLLEDKGSFRNGKTIDSSQNVRALLLSDPHLLGSRYGHWFDKLRREWQMKRSFQTALKYFKPEVVFILGDLFDEGMICDDEEWKRYVSRFHSIFNHPSDVELYVVPGNHDVGFHYRVAFDSKLNQRFGKDFDITGIRMLNIKGNVFLLLNSMAFEQDGCTLCREAEKDLKTVSQRLKCLHKNRIAFNMWKKRCEMAPALSDPILLQHFPLYRSSEVNCSGKDAPPVESRSRKNRGGWEVISKTASELLLSTLQPRIIFSGHTHHSCYLEHQGNIPEHTLASFSWRNRNDPSFLMATFNPNAYSTQKCFLPEENSVILLYIILGIFGLCCILWKSIKRKFGRSCHVKTRIFYHRLPVKVC